MQSPWGGYPGYTSVQVEDFNRDGEEAWMLRAAYCFRPNRTLARSLGGRRTPSPLGPVIRKLWQ